MMAQGPIITTELARRIEQIDLDYTLSRLGGMQAAAGNPLQIEIRPFGGATAFSIQAWPDFWYGNRVLGLSQVDEGQLEHMVNFFGELPFRFEIIPGQLNWSLATRLHQLGFCQGSFSAAMYGPPQADTMPPTAPARVREMEPEELELFPFEGAAAPFPFKIDLSLEEVGEESRRRGKGVERGEGEMRESDIFCVYSS